MLYKVVYRLYIMLMLCSTICLAEMLDFNLFLTPAFTIIFFAVLVVMMAYFIPFAYCSQRAELLGVGKKSSFLVSILGKWKIDGRDRPSASVEVYEIQSVF